MPPRKKILVMITHSLGELDVLFPLFAGVKAEYDVKVEMVFTVKKIYRQFESNDFYRFCTKELDIKITNCQLPNKFDYRESRLMRHMVGRLLIKCYFKALQIIKSLFLFKKLFQADAYMHEYSNQVRSTFLIYWVNKILGRKIFVYHHGHAIDMDKIVKNPINYDERTVALVFHKHSSRYFNDLGYTDQFIIGYPKFYSEWNKLIKRYISKNPFNENIALIFSRHVHPFYMDENKYKKLLISSCQIIRKKLNNIPIIIKPHPRESTDLINKVLLDNNILNCSISKDHAAILAKSATLSISFWGSVILDSLSVQTPCIEYYIEADKFRKAEPGGSAYKKLGIHSTDSERGLETFIDSVIDQRYSPPAIIDKLGGIKDVSFLYKT